MTGRDHFRIGVHHGRSRFVILISENETGMSLRNISMPCASNLERCPNAKYLSLSLPTWFRIRLLEISSFFCRYALQAHVL